MASSQFISNLSLPDQALLSTLLHSRELRRGEVLFRADEKVDAAYFPYSGMVSHVVQFENGACVEVGVAGSHSVVGAGAALSNGIALNQAVGQIDGHGGTVNMGELRILVGESGTLRAALFRAEQALSSQAQQSAACNAAHNLDQRFCRWILTSSAFVGGDEVDVTQEFLAQMLSVNRSSVTQIALRLQADGLIQYHRGKILILDRIGFEKRSCECYVAIRDRLSRLIGLSPPEGHGEADSAKRP